MATYDRWIRTIENVEYTIPADQPYGAAWVEVYKAVHAIHEELRAAGEIGVDEEAPDDRIRILPGEDEIVVFYERSRRTRSSEGDVRAGPGRTVA